MIKTTYNEVKDGQLFCFLVQSNDKFSHLKLEKNRLATIGNKITYTYADEDFFKDAEVIIYNDFDLAGRVAEYVESMDRLAEHYVK